MNHTIEPMVVEDFEEITALWRNTEGVGLSESDGQAGVARFLERNPNLSLVARDTKRKIIGAVMCGHDGRRGCLYHLAVAGDYRRQGIGKELIAMCLAKLKALGLDRCNLFVYADNADGRAFWQHLGWNERVDLRMMQQRTSNC